VTEDRQARHHRQLDELLTEIRVVLPGVQVLFAFLLSLPFLASFRTVTAAERVVYFVAFLATTGSMALLIVPPAYHRVRFQQHRKAGIIRTGNRFALLALALLGLAVTCVVYVVTDALYHWPAALGTAGAVGLLCASLWYWLPRASVADASVDAEARLDTEPDGDETTPEAGGRAGDGADDAATPSVGRPGAERGRRAA